MKKVIAIALSLLLVFAVVPMTMITASAETFEKTIITFDDDSDRTYVGHTADYNHKIEEAEGFGTGNSASLNMPSSKSNSLYFRLTSGWKAYQPTAIKFLIKNTDISQGDPTLKIGFGSTSSLAVQYTQGLTVVALSTAEWVTVSLEGLDISEFDYMAIGKPSANACIYIDNITLVCPTSALAESSYEWTTIEDFENGIPETLTKSANPVTLSASTEFATGTATASTASVMAKTSGWNDQRKSNYVTYAIDESIAAVADDIRVFIKAAGKDLDYFGIVMDGTTYWKKTYGNSYGVFTNTWAPCYVLDEIFVSEADSTTKIIRSDDISKITDLKFSFSQNTQYGTNLYIDDIEYAVFKSSGSTTPASPVTMEEGASIRLGAVNGIRFYTTVDEEALATLVGENTYEIGTIIAPADSLGEDNELTVDDRCIVVAYKARTADGSIKYHNAEKKQIAGSIVNIRETGDETDTNGNIDRDFMARAYVKVGDTYYYSATTSTRSLQAVANAYKENNYGDATLDEAVKKAVDNWAIGKPKDYVGE